MSWTKIAKPTTSGYTNINPQGKEQFDQVDVTYDSATVYYDGVNHSAWTKITKPSSETWTSINKPT